MANRLLALLPIRPPPHARRYIKFPIICSNEEPQQDTSGDYHNYVAKFLTWANTTKTAAKALGVWPVTLQASLLRSTLSNRRTS